MALQTFTPGQTLTASQMNSLQAAVYNASQKTVTTVSYSLLSEDKGKTIVFTNAGSITVNVPDSLNIDDGDSFFIIQAGTGTLTFTADNGITLHSEGGLLSLSNQWSSVTLMRHDSDEYILTGFTAIAEAEIINGSISTNKLAAGAVTSAKIANGTIVDDDVSSSAAIALSKLATGALPTDITIASANIVNGTIVDADINSSAAIDKTKIAGTAITAADVGTVTGLMIADGTIVNADINSSASIAHSKLASMTAGQVLLGNSSNVPTSTALSGDITVDSSGVAAISSGVIVNADINSSAAIALTKLSGTAANLRTALGSESTGTGNAVFASGATLSGPTLDGAYLTNVTSLAQVKESITVASNAYTSATTVNIDAYTSTVYYNQGSTTNSVTLNLRGNSSTKLADFIPLGSMITFVYMLTSGSTSGKIVNITCDDSTVSLKWFGGSAPAGNGGGSVDVYTINAVRVSGGTPTFHVFASQSKFG